MAAGGAAGLTRHGRSPTATPAGARAAPTTRLGHPQSFHTSGGDDVREGLIFSSVPPNPLECAARTVACGLRRTAPRPDGVSRYGPWSGAEDLREAPRPSGR